MAKRKALQDRCDHCGEWVAECSLVNLTTELHPMLRYENEFSICQKCSKRKSYNIEYWSEWIPKKRKDRLTK